MVTFAWPKVLTAVPPVQVMVCPPRSRIGFVHLGAFPVVVFKRPFPHSRVCKSLSFQPFHFLPVLVFPVSGFQRFPAFPLAVTFFGVAVTSEKGLALREVGFFGLAAAPAI